MKYKESFKKECILIGKNIKRFREARKMTIKELSINTGIRVLYLKKIEAGIAYGMYLDKHLIKIANALTVKISELFYRK